MSDRQPLNRSLTVAGSGHWMRRDMFPNTDAVATDAREMINEAACRAGMSVTAWLNAVIISAAANQGVQPVRYVLKDQAEKPKPKRRDYASIHSRIDELAAKIGDLVDDMTAAAELEESASRAAATDVGRRKVLSDQIPRFLRAETHSARWTPQGTQRRTLAVR